MKTCANAAPASQVEQGQYLSSVRLLALTGRAQRSAYQEPLYRCAGILTPGGHCQSIDDKPLKGKQRPLHFLLLVGLPADLHTGPRACRLSETVNACRLPAMGRELSGFTQRRIGSNVQRQPDFTGRGKADSPIPAMLIRPGC